MNERDLNTMYQKVSDMINNVNEKGHLINDDDIELMNCLKTLKKRIELNKEDLK